MCLYSDAKRKPASNPTDPCEGGWKRIKCAQKLLLCLKTVRKKGPWFTTLAREPVPPHGEGEMIAERNPKLTEMFWSALGGVARVARPGSLYVNLYGLAQPKPAMLVQLWL